MMKDGAVTVKEFPGIDIFRMIAAFLVVAIHTAPLVSISLTGDFLFTRIIGRVAVPFFFMASGFFLIPHYMDRNLDEQGNLKGFLVKTAKIYCVAIVLYLPINIYGGMFSEGFSIGALMRSLLFEGTLYHLWYLPASMLGATVVCLLLKKLKARHVMGVTLVLYAIGLLGDSYYGIAEKSSLLTAVYDAIFTVSGYTRNGLFFAPVFLAMGGLLGKQEIWQDKRRQYASGFLLSLALMCAEGLLLHGLQFQRHDSMYISLIPCMYFLFKWLLTIGGQGKAQFRNQSLIIYLIHPAVIIAVRGFAKILHLESIFIDNNLIHFVAVALGSYMAAIVITLVLDRIKKKGKENECGKRRKSLDRSQSGQLNS